LKEGRICRFREPREGRRLVAFASGMETCVNPTSEAVS
jgi:hypothetical protein